MCHAVLMVAAGLFVATLETSVALHLAAGDAASAGADRAKRCATARLPLPSPLRGRGRAQLTGGFLVVGARAAEGMANLRTFYQGVLGCAVVAWLLTTWGESAFLSTFPLPAWFALVRLMRFSLAAAFASDLEPPPAVGGGASNA